MNKYYIYNMDTDKLIGEIVARSIIDAERKACEKFDKYSDEIYALSEKIV